MTEPLGSRETPRCGAKTRSGGSCQRFPVRGRERCPKHGGKTPRGPASPHWKHGQRSRYLPRGLRQRVERLISDPDLVALDLEVATVRGLIEAALERHVEGEKLPAGTLALFDQLRRLAIAERRRREALEGSISVHQAFALVDAVTTAVANNVRDPKVLEAIMADFDRLLKPLREIGRATGSLPQPTL